VRGRRYSGGFGRQHFSHYRRGRDRTELSRPSRPVRQQPGVRSRGSGAARDRGPR
jgi:hypothetical protein